MLLWKTVFSSGGNNFRRFAKGWLWGQNSQGLKPLHKKRQGNGHPPHVLPGFGYIKKNRVFFQEEYEYV